MNAAAEALFITPSDPKSAGAISRTGAEDAVLCEMGVTLKEVGTVLDNIETTIRWLAQPKPHQVDALRARAGELRVRLTSFRKRFR